MTSFYQYFWQSGFMLELQQPPRSSDQGRSSLTFPVSSTICTYVGPPCNRCGRLLCYRTNRALDMWRLVFGCCCPSKFIRLWASHWVSLNLRLLIYEVWTVVDLRFCVAETMMYFTQHPFNPFLLVFCSTSKTMFPELSSSKGTVMWHNSFIYTQPPKTFIQRAMWRSGHTRWANLPTIQVAERSRSSRATIFEFLISGLSDKDVKGQGPRAIDFLLRQQSDFSWPWCFASVTSKSCYLPLCELLWTIIFFNKSFPLNSVEVDYVMWNQEAWR